MKNFKRKIEDTILYEDKEILVCHKPAGFPVQSGRIGEMDMESAIRNYLAERGEGSYVGLVHRLDQPVQGILVFGKSQRAAGELSRQMQQGKMKKLYLAAVQGVPEQDEGKLENELERIPGTNLSRAVQKKTGKSKRAVLEYRVLEKAEGKSLLEIQLHTGRHHQIRVQLAYAGFPLLGDTKYNPVWREKGKEKTELGLCAYKLKFVNPGNGKEMEFQVKPQGNFPFL